METIKNIRERLGVRKMPHGHTRQFSEEERDKIKKLWEDGNALYKIGQAIPASTACVTAILREMGIATSRRIASGVRSGTWKGGKVWTSNGYCCVMVSSEDPMAKMRNRYGYVFEHRLIMARHLNRPLTISETVHHVNGIKTDNRIENLQLRNGRHGKGISLACLDCGSKNIQPVPLLP